MEFSRPTKSDVGTSTCPPPAVALSAGRDVEVVLLVLVLVLLALDGSVAGGAADCNEAPGGSPPTAPGVLVPGSRTVVDGEAVVVVAGCDVVVVDPVVLELSGDDVDDVAESDVTAPVHVNATVS